MVDNTLGLVCPVCNSSSFLLKYEATYVYSYVIDSDAPGLNNTERFFTFLYDDREQTATKQFLECTSCGATYLCCFNQWDHNIGVKDLQDAIYSNCNLE
ncbi:MAG: hypothetical protein APF84_16650 [Gracilibacter sp. BRH_c7a]|nr:MAG: hypothetical protein APF84_16650 [Gracilibacter sp. BRH_c7a]